MVSYIYMFMFIYALNEVDQSYGLTANWVS